MSEDEVQPVVIDNGSCMIKAGKSRNGHITLPSLHPTSPKLISSLGSQALPGMTHQGQSFQGLSVSSSSVPFLSFALQPTLFSSREAKTQGCDGWNGSKRLVTFLALLWETFVTDYRFTLLPTDMWATKHGPNEAL